MGIGDSQLLVESKDQDGNGFGLTKTSRSSKYQYPMPGYMFLKLLLYEHCFQMPSSPIDSINSLPSGSEFDGAGLGAASSLMLITLITLFIY